MISKIVKAWKDGGLSTVAQRSFNLGYEKIRTQTPRKDREFNNVTVEGHILDRFSSLYKMNQPEYEEALVKCVDSFVQEGDKAVIIGGGYGVAAVYTSKAVGEEGDVTVFEAAIKMLRKCRKTLDINNCSNVETVQGIFYEDKDVWGDFSEAENLNAEDIPESDVLILDCEGVEKDILVDLEQKPETIIVESHKQFDAPKKLVLDLLDRQGYDIQLFLVDDEEEGTDVIVGQRGVSQ